jgi:PHD/YefM family antitoxin component YafN of YafNO toxin-antitoxin module
MGIGIREARQNLPTLIKRAAQYDEDIQLGARGADEVTLVSTDKYERMRRELDHLQGVIERLTARLETASATADRLAGEVQQPFAGLQRALEEGRLSVQPDDAPRVRRYIPGYTGISPVSREEQIRLASRSPQPAQRRTLPRA